MNKLISIVIPLFNEKDSIKPLIHQLEVQLESIPHEIICIDDNSTDNSFGIIKHLRNPHVRVYKKSGKKGKAYSLVEGFEKARGEILVMIDADLQYSPEDILPMIEKLIDADIVIANRKISEVSPIRNLMSKTFRTFFGKGLFSLHEDIQSGLKVFTRAVWESIKFSPKSPWTFDLEFLHRARQAGFVLSQYDITFTQRKKGVSKISYLTNSLEIARNAVHLRLTQIKPLYINDANSPDTTIGYKKKQFVTHTSLHHESLALRTFTPTQLLLIFLGGTTLLVLLIRFPLFTLQLLVGVLSFIYFFDACFHLYLMMRSVRKNITISHKATELEDITDDELPIYTILCPLYKEAHVLPGFLTAIENIEYPKEKLDVILLLEEDDTESIQAVRNMEIPMYVRSLIVPDSFPKTKPKACNYGLKHAKGDMLVIYDAEDIPDPKQLKKAYLAFKKLPRNVICLQAQLNYYNPEQNLLTRFFTAEYSLWFDVILPGLQSFNTTIPLGGTSNHFRTEDLRLLLGWDPFNVTEDADLGVRLFRKGYKTAVINSTTFEEANSDLKNWVRQRSRWIKGYMQTYLVHLRRQKTNERQSLRHRIMFHLTIGGKLAFILINPLLWIITLLYYVANKYVGSQIELLYVPLVFYMAIISLVFGNFMYLYFYMVGLAKRGQWSLIKYVYLIPLYWIMISYAGAVAFYQLLFKPHYWEKTIHGLTKTATKKDIAQIIKPVPQRKHALQFPKISLPTFPTIAIPAFQNPKLLTALFLISPLIANGVTVGFTIYLGRVLDLANLSVYAVVSSIVALSSILFAALTASSNYRTGFLRERYSHSSAYLFLRSVRKKSVFLGIFLTFLWMLGTPYLQRFFHFSSALPLLIITPLWIICAFQATTKGYLSGITFFGSIIFLILFEMFLKVYIGTLLITFHNTALVYSSLPLSIMITAFFVLFFIKKPAVMPDPENKSREVKAFPTKFFLTAFLSGLSTILFLNADTLLVRHFFSSFDSGRYMLITTVGKVIFLITNVVTQLILSVVGNDEDNTEKNFTLLILLTFGTAFLGFIMVGLLGNITLPLLFGSKAYLIQPFIPSYTLGVLSFSLAIIFVSYYLSKKIYSFALALVLFSVSELILLMLHHDSLDTVVWIVMMVGILELFFIIVLHFHIKVITRTEKIFFEIFANRGRTVFDGAKPRILIFNWRDMHHAWAGGAELYIHELAKRFVQEGCQVTLFTARDVRCAPRQTVDGMRIIRKGGFYTVYFWAFIYYMLRLRRDTDVIIDSENGIPFFTPLYARKPVFLLIHHVHQHVFRNHLHFPLSTIAKFLEGVCMPYVYQKNTIITVSESSKEEIVSLGLRKDGQVQIVHPGIDEAEFYKSRKTAFPSFIYLGRLKTYKHIDLAIIAFAKVKEAYPKAKFFIVGEGEDIQKLLRLVKRLGLLGSVEFFGKVTDTEKSSLLGKSWVMLQPSEVEGFGITVVEANASGTPVIASRVNGLKDSVVDGKTGILVTPDVESLAEAMILLISNGRLRRSLSENAFLWSKNYHWEDSAKRFLRIISLETRQHEHHSLHQAVAKEVA